MPLKIRISMSDHAWKRWRAHSLHGKPVKIICGRLYDRLRMGAQMDKDGAVHVFIGQEAYAVCCPVDGGWKVITIYIPGIHIESA